jgi:hypothetical protein
MGWGDVWRVDPGPNATFGDADDVVSHFDMERFGPLDPRASPRSRPATIS